MSSIEITKKNIIFKVTKQTLTQILLKTPQVKRTCLPNPAISTMVR